MSEASTLNTFLFCHWCSASFPAQSCDFYEKCCRKINFLSLFSSCWHKWPFLEEDHSRTSEHWKRTDKRGMPRSCRHNLPSSEFLTSFWNIFHPPASFFVFYVWPEVYPRTDMFNCKYFLIHSVWQTVMSLQVVYCRVILCWLLSITWV